MSVTLTEKAAFRIRNFLRASATTEATPNAIRLAVQDGGCSGYEYKLDITSKQNQEDLVFEQDKVRIYIDPKSEPLLKGVVIDFVESFTESGFVFSNPNATDSCGCGKSFQAGDCTPAAVPCS